MSGVCDESCSNSPVNGIPSNISSEQAEIICKVGDGTNNAGGSTDTRIEPPMSFTIDECIAAVKEQHPTANGATMNKDCTATDAMPKCSCWAEFNMNSWSGSNHWSCMWNSLTASSGEDTTAIWDAKNYKTFEDWYAADNWWGCYYTVDVRTVPLKSYPYSLFFSPSYPSNYKEFGQNKACGWKLSLTDNVTSPHQLVLQFLNFDIEVLAKFLIIIK